MGIRLSPHRCAPILLAVGLLFALGAPAPAQPVDITAPGNPIVGVAATVGSNTSLLATVGTVPNTNNYPAGEPPASAIDNITGGIPNQGNKYLNFLETGAGFIVTPTTNSIVAGLHFFTGNDAPERDPLTVTLEGSTDANATTTLNSTWVLLYSGPSGLATDPGRNASGPNVFFANTQSLRSYRLLVSTVRNAATANSFQFQEIELLSPIPEPSSVALCGVALAAFGTMWRRRRAAAG